MCKKSKREVTKIISRVKVGGNSTKFIMFPKDILALLQADATGDSCT